MLASPIRYSYPVTVTFAIQISKLLIAVVNGENLANDALTLNDLFPRLLYAIFIDHFPLAW